jgi:hypothetical protein
MVNFMLEYHSQQTLSLYLHLFSIEIEAPYRDFLISFYFSLVFRHTQTPFLNDHLPLGGNNLRVGQYDKL